jgi:hypothetical protein
MDEKLRIIWFTMTFALLLVTVNLLYDWFQTSGSKAGTSSAREISALIDSIKKQITADRFSSIKVI